MKRIVVVLGLICILLSACQPTPEKEIVINKNNENQVSKNPDALTIEDSRKWKEEFEYYNGKLNINVDADILVPQTQIWPIYDVTLVNYTQAEADAIIKALCGDAKLYDQSGAITRGELEEQLIALQLELKQREDGTYTGNSDNSIDNLRRSIELLQEQIPDAPENSDAREITTQMVYDGALDANFLFANVKLGQSKDATIDIRSGCNLPYSENSIVFRNGDPFDTLYNFKEASDVNITREEAIGQGDALLAQMGISGYGCAAVKVGIKGLSEQDRTAEALSNAEKCWLLYYTKEYNGIVSTFDEQEGTWGLKDAEIDAPPVYYDRIEIAIGDQGISSFVWHGREKENGILNENAALMPFEEIKQVFLNGTKLKYAYIEDAEGKSGQGETWECVANRIELGYMRIMSGNGVVSYQAIPVWDFFGTVGPISEDKGLASNSDYMSLITINAIDGSIIDRGIGY